MLYPTTEELPAFQERFTLCCVDDPEAAPDPERASETVLPVLVTKDAVPEAEPLLCGLKVTVKLLLDPAATVKGRLTPLKTHSALLVPAEETVTLLPLAEIVPVRLLVLPTVTVPKLRLDGVTASCPVAAPVPESAMFKAGAVEVMAMLPLALPALLGANPTEKVTLLPA
jgi:hypothetical protein